MYKAQVNKSTGYKQRKITKVSENALFQSMPKLYRSRETGQLWNFYEQNQVSASVPQNTRAP
jgi:hypothetical protein